MPNNRTTKRERTAARRRLPAACRRWGTAYTARASRTLNDAAIRLALALDVPPHIIASAAPGANHWAAAVEPGPSPEGELAERDRRIATAAGRTDA